MEQTNAYVGVSIVLLIGLFFALLLLFGHRRSQADFRAHRASEGLEDDGESKPPMGYVDTVVGVHDFPSNQYMQGAFQPQTCTVPVKLNERHMLQLINKFPWMAQVDPHRIYSGIIEVVREDNGEA